MDGARQIAIQILFIFLFFFRRKEINNSVSWAEK